jgi:FixJ family two-component response regulator
MHPAVVLCERRLTDGTWKDILDLFAPDRPNLIVTAQQSDVHVWSEVLNLGGFDVMEKPFDRRKVFRAVSLARRHWKDRHRVQSPEVSAAVA